MDINTLKLYIESQINAANKELKAATAKTKIEHLKGKVEAYRDVYTQMTTKPKKDEPASYEIEGALFLANIFQSDVRDEILKYITSNMLEICINGEELIKVGEASGYLSENAMFIFKGTVEAFADKKTINSLIPHLMYEGEGIVKILLNNDMTEAQVRVK